jgi:hypothetical protein
MLVLPMDGVALKYPRVAKDAIERQLPRRIIFIGTGQLQCIKMPEPR